MGRRDRRPLFAERTLPNKPKLPEGKALGEPDTRVEKIRAAMAAGDWHEALRLATKLQSLGTEEAAITRAWEALVRPEFLRQVKKDPAVAFEDGKAALRRRFP